MVKTKRKKKMFTMNLKCKSGIGIKAKRTMVLKCVYYFTVYVLEWGEKKLFKIFFLFLWKFKIHISVGSITEDFETLFVEIRNNNIPKKFMNYNNLFNIFLRHKFIRNNFTSHLICN